MDFNRRDTLLLAVGAAASSMPALPALASDNGAQAAIDAFAGGAAVTEGGVEIGVPEIAENGSTVPVQVSAEGATAIMLLATGNPNPGVATFRFGALSAASRAATRIRLTQTQELIAVAQMADGSFASATRTVQVTIGGCSG